VSPARPATERASRAGSLVLVATPIGNLGDLSARALEVLGTADLLCCEDTRHTGRLLSLAGVTAPRLMSLHQHNEASRIADVLKVLEAGGTVALVSDAGTPLVSDPGARVVQAVIAAGFPVIAVPGPSAVLAALVISGFSTERFSFEGFLPRRGAERGRRLDAIATADAPTVIYEAPGRVATTLRELCERTEPERRVAVGRELTKRFEEVVRGPVAEVIETLKAQEERGEYVVVIDGATVAADGGIDLDHALRALLGAGLGPREAVSALVALHGVSHREAYARALELRPTVPAPARTRR
jgi:16S rRNA (cytidine1402-2'-O)-methyltransferase